MIRPPAGWHRPAGTLPNYGGEARRPPVVPIERYRPLVRAPIGNGVATAVVNAQGQAVAFVGPSGLGTRWYVKKGDISTTTGANDTSTCQIFIGPSVAGMDQFSAGQSYAGGGDTFGLAGEDLQPGWYITAIWSGANPGDTATLRVTGDQVVMIA